MPEHPEERRIADLLRELIVRSGTTPEAVEKRLNWKPDRLTALLDGRLALSLEDALEVLPVIGVAPTDFFARLFGTPGKGPSPSAGDESRRQRALERLFERSLRVVRNAIGRRAAWKREQTKTGDD